MRCFLLLALVVAANAALAPYYTPAKNRVEGKYIVVLEDDVSVDQITTSFANKVTRKYATVLNGFVVEGVNLDLLRSLPGVKYVEEDEIVTALGANLNTGSWGIDRIDQRNLPLDNRMILNEYGVGTHIYVIDSGINPTHSDFGGRASIAGDWVGDGRNGHDCNGHGTHCAGTAGGNNYGVANEASLYACRTLNCAGSGYKADSIAALDWIADYGARPAVASMSLGGSYSSAQNEAVAKCRNAGVVVSVAAGNDNGDACNGSPSSAPAALTVGSTDSSDRRSSFSNWGSCVNLFAPGSSITSAYHTSNTATRSMSGTSMACPHVSGIAAVYLSQGFSTEGTYTQVISVATAGKVTDPRGTANLLAYAD